MRRWRNKGIFDFVLGAYPCPSLRFGAVFAYAFVPQAQAYAGYAARLTVVRPRRKRRVFCTRFCASRHKLTQAAAATAPHR
jgi:hypothetical protein